MMARLNSMEYQIQICAGAYYIKNVFEYVHNVKKNQKYHDHFNKQYLDAHI